MKNGLNEGDFKGKKCNIPTFFTPAISIDSQLIRQELALYFAVVGLSNFRAFIRA